MGGKRYYLGMQPFEWHVRLLHHILLPVGEYSPRDPRPQLRHVEVAQGSAHRDFAGHGFARRLCQVEQLGPKKLMMVWVLFASQAE